RIGAVMVYDTVARETTVISSSAGMIIYSMSTAVAFLMAAAYVAVLSLVSFVAIIVLFCAWFYFYRFSQRNSRPALVEAKTAETRFFELFSHLLYGFKEIKLHSARGEDLQKVHLLAASRNAELKNVIATQRFNHGLTVSITMYYVLLTTAAFILPQHLGDART